jgi:hypothetical protein
MQDCPCCGYHYGSYFPRHCPDTKVSCGWFTCKHCGAITTADGQRHTNHKEHGCGRETAPEAPEEESTSE